VRPVVVLERVLVELAAVPAKQVDGVRGHHVLVQPAERRLGRLGVVGIDREQPVRVGVGHDRVEVRVLDEPVERVGQLPARATPEAEQEPAPGGHRPVHEAVATHRAGEVDGRSGIERRVAAGGLRGGHGDQRLAADHAARVRWWAGELGRARDLARAIGKAL
jgi:hypothetical protein